MGNLLQGCFLYRWALAIFAWFSRVADGSRVRHGISLCWEGSKLAAFLHRCLSSGTVQIDESRTKRLLSDCTQIDRPLGRKLRSLPGIPQRFYLWARQPHPRLAVSWRYDGNFALRHRALCSD